MDMWPTLCSVVGCHQVCASLKYMVTHVSSDHMFESNLIVKCPMDSCKSRFTNGTSFRLHASRFHRPEYTLGSRAASCRHLPQDGVENVDLGSELEVGVEHSTSDSESPSACDKFEAFMKNLPLRTSTMRLLMEHKCDIPTSVARMVYDGISMCQQFGEVALLRLQELGVEDPNLKYYLECPELERTCKSITEGIFAPFRRLGYVEPKQIDLLDFAEDLGHHFQETPGVKRPVMHYVPILETLKSFLSHQDVMKNVLREDLSPDYLSSFTSGSLYREHPLFSEEPNALRLTLYTDELELCNPLGGNNVKHKICCVYFQVRNVGTKYMSALQTIHLALLVKDSFKNKFGYGIVLKPLIEDLKVLATRGIQVSIKDGGSANFRGAVVAVCGNNLSSHHLGGFRRTFSSGKVCRWCMADYSGLSKLHSERDCNLRSAARMQRHAELVAEDDKLVPLYGVFGKSVLWEIPFLQVPVCRPT